MQTADATNFLKSIFFKTSTPIFLEMSVMSNRLRIIKYISEFVEVQHQNNGRHAPQNHPSIVFC